MGEERKVPAQPANDRPESGKRRFRLGLEYDGTEFYGWQLQPERRTVQGVLEAALEELFGTPIRVHGAGRTDTGVHALGQIAHFDVPSKFTPDVIQRALNHFLPDDVKIFEVLPVSPDFHARFSARWRWYRYRMFTVDRAIERHYGWFPGFEFDAGILHKTTALLIGERDFTAFASADAETDDHRCEVYAARWEQWGDEWHFHIVANRFLHHMVRSLVGTILDTARGRFTVGKFEEILSSEQQNFSVYTAPARGLCLMKVGYGSFPLLDDESGIVQKFPFDVDK